MKCPLCHKQKGKRGCKLNEGQRICPRCCGTVRRDECAGCSYFESSLAYQHDKPLRSKQFITEIIREVDDKCGEALALVEKGRVAEGQAILEELAKAHPNYHTILYGLGVCHGLQRRPDDAIACLKRAVDVYPLFAEAHYNLATSYCQKLDLASAVKAYRDAIEVDGEHGEIGQKAREHLNSFERMTMENSGISLSKYLRNQEVFQKAYAALKERRFQAAIDLFNQVLAVDKKHVQSHDNIGLAYAGLGNKQKALEYLDKAIALDPEYEPALLNRLAVERLADGEVLFDLSSNEDIDYYREYKMKGRSRIKELLQSIG